MGPGAPKALSVSFQSHRGFGGRAPVVPVWGRCWAVPACPPGNTTRTRFRRPQTGRLRGAAGGAGRRRAGAGGSPPVPLWPDAWCGRLRAPWPLLVSSRGSEARERWARPPAPAPAPRPTPRPNTRGSVAGIRGHRRRGELRVQGTACTPGAHRDLGVRCSHQPGEAESSCIPRSAVQGSVARVWPACLAPATCNVQVSRDRRWAWEHGTGALSAKPLEQSRFPLTPDPTRLRKAGNGHIARGTCRAHRTGLCPSETLPLWLSQLKGCALEAALGPVPTSQAEGTIPLPSSWLGSSGDHLFRLCCSRCCV